MKFLLKSNRYNTRKIWMSGFHTFRLKKTFDKVPHRRLLWKLEHIGGLKGTLNNWMGDYLKGSEMRTVVKNEESEWREIKNGVLHGSVLAPIMFLIYVNDMTEGVSSYISLFTDDAKLLRKIRNHKNCEELQNDINRIYEWSKTWEMKYNAKKKMPCIGNEKKV